MHRLIPPATPLQYFAYGSNMSHRRLRARVPSASKLANATLYRHRLCFHKRGQDGSAKCDALQGADLKYQVRGVLFEISAADKPGLDRLEGLGVGYAVKDVAVRLDNGALIQAYTYSAMLIDPALRPYHWYKEHVLRGAIENQLGTAYIASIQQVESIADPNPERHVHELAIYLP
jgi:hypothetical protein